MNRLYYTLLTCFLGIAANAQEINVLTLKQLMSAEAGTHAYYDANGDKCALIKVAIPALDNVLFQGTYVAKSELRGNEYWVYVAKGAKKMRVSHKNFLPLDVTFKDFFDGDIASGTTYQLNLKLQQDLQNQTIAIIRTNLKKASLTIDGKTITTTDGEFSVPLDKGMHNYTLSTSIPGFNPKSGSFEVKGDEAVEIIPQITFETEKKYTLTLTAEKDVRFKVDGKVQSQTGRASILLPAGTHSVESYVGDGTSFYKRVEVDMTSANVTQDMSLGGTLVMTSPLNTDFEIKPLDGALAPSKSKFTSGEVISLLGNYSLTALKKGYDKKTITISVSPGKNEKQIDLVSKADKYYNGWDGETRDSDKALKEYKKMADKGDDIAQYKVGNIYSQMSANMPLAISYWKQAAAQGNTEAMLALGKNVQNDTERIKYLTPPAEAGNHEAEYLLGSTYFRLNELHKLIGGKKDAASNGNSSSPLDKALEWTQKAYDNGVANTSALMAKIYIARKEYDEAYNILRPAAISGEPEAAKLLASMGGDYALRIAEYFWCKEPRDINNAANWYEPIAMQNLNFRFDINIILYTIGQYFYDGDSKARGVSFYEMAYNRGYTNGDMFRELGTAYYNGKFVKQDYSKAVLYYTKGMNDDNKICTRMLASCYEKGYSVPMNKSKAIELYQKAINMGDDRSYAFLGTLHYQGKNINEALSLWRTGAEKDDKTCMKNLVKYLSSRKDDESRQELAKWQEKLNAAQ